ncbi:unnamed protein product [Prorocentrum cordatum]|uniref:Uncharacterized protein n=1 Tax=Prorocentrum cordatum TaxID=2364126 RepID=A0ABN9W9Z3_9DINO|nr:unnamed protein product [Polarella glacialis]
MAAFRGQGRESAPLRRDGARVRTWSRFSVRGARDAKRETELHRWVFVASDALQAGVKEQPRNWAKFMSEKDDRIWWYNPEKPDDWFWHPVSERGSASAFSAS